MLQQRASRRPPPAQISVIAHYHALPISALAAVEAYMLKQNKRRTQFFTHKAILSLSLKQSDSPKLLS